MSRRILLGLIAAAALACGVLVYNLSGTNRAGAPAAAPGSALLKPVTAQDLFARIDALESPVVLVNFWASWCEPCKKEFPSILSLREKLNARGLKVIFVSIDEPRDFQAAEDFLREHKVDFQTFYKGAQDLKFVSEIYPKWEGAVPTTVLFGPRHEIVDAWEGDATLAEFEKRVMRHLGGS